MPRAPPCVSVRGGGGGGREGDEGRRREDVSDVHTPSELLIKPGVVPGEGTPSEGSPCCQEDYGQWETPTGKRHVSAVR